MEVWAYLEQLAPSGSDLGMTEGRTARAALCVLEPDGGDEAARVDTVEWFRAMVDSG